MCHRITARLGRVKRKFLDIFTYWNFYFLPNDVFFRQGDYVLARLSLEIDFKLRIIVL